MRVGWVLGLVAACSKPVAAPMGDSGAPTTPVGGSGSTTTSGSPTGSVLDTAAGLVVDLTDSSFLVELGELAWVEGVAVGPGPEAIALAWSSDRDGALGTAAPDPNGEFRFDSAALTAGWHAVAIEATQGEAVAVADTTIGVCTWPPIEDFAAGASISGWTLFGNAAWDPGGWLEVTGNIQGSDGAIYKTDMKVNPGDVTIEFDIATGGGINTGADGFSVNVIDAYDEVELAAIVNAAANGGCLGYGTSGACGSLPISAFHVEFDTWHNPELGDATAENHLAIALDGDPAPMLWVAVPTLEDLAWRHVRVEIVGSMVTVFMDGAQVIQGTLPGFTFDGGYIGVSGSTGWATNYHRFDNLQLFDLCRVP